ncbi:MAG: GNAT family N-acetyltransferase [Christensenellales bacterium]
MSASPGAGELATQRLTLCRLARADAAGYLASPDCAALLMGDEAADSDGFWRRLPGRYADGRFFLWAVRERGSDRAVGFVRAWDQPATDSVRLTFAMDPALRRRGYMKEAIGAILSYLLCTVGVNRIEAFCTDRHRDAGKALLRCGFEAEGQLRQAVCWGGEIADLRVYALLRQTAQRVEQYAGLGADDLWITNYRERGGEHLRSLTRLPREEAAALARRLSARTASKNDRYGAYFERYYEKRLNTERWLFDQFQKQGGQPQTRHPIYFTLCDSPSLEAFYGQDDRMRIALRDVPEGAISFTPRDSMHLRDMGLTVGTVWGKQELLAMLGGGRGVGERIVGLSGLYGQSGGYIEAQLWDDAYLPLARRC